MSRCDTLCLAHFRASIVFRLCAALFMFLFVVGISPLPTTLELIKTRGYLTVVALAQDGQVSDRTLPQSFSGEITHLLSENLGVATHVIWATSQDDAFARLRRHEADIALTSMISQDPGLMNIRYSKTYQDVSLQLIQKIQPHHDADLELANGDYASLLRHAKIAVYAQSNEAQLAKQLQEQLPGIQLQIIPDNRRFSTLLDLVSGQQADFALVNASAFAEHRALHTDLRVVMNLSHAARLAWAFAPGSDTSFYNRAQLFLQQRNDDGTLKRMAAFYKPEQHSDRREAHGFNYDLRSRLPVYAGLFQSYAKKYHLDWHVIAAIAYQESHWHPDAVSPAGASGMMMLMAPTAASLGVHNRQNANESIRAGCNYFRMLVDSLPDDVKEPDRTWMALAAYNKGPGYLQKARQLTQKQHRNPDLWSDVREVMAGLGHHHATDDDTETDATPHSQVLAYVSQVKRYYDTLLLAHPNEFQRNVAER